MAPTTWQLCIFDSRRGQQEGHELDKILYFFPLDCPLPVQLSVVGLSEGLITFSRIFSPTHACEYMKGEKNTHIFLECEPDIWMVIIIEKNGDDQSAREGAYRNILKNVYGIFYLFYGSLRTLLQNYPLGDVARSCLYAFIPDYIADLLLGKNLWLPTVSDSLAEHGAIQMLSFDREVLLDAQSLVSLLDSWYDGKTVKHSMILFHNYLISSTLSPVDTTRLYCYAVMRLIPAAISQSFAHGPKRSYFRNSVLNSVVSSLKNELHLTSTVSHPSAKQSTVSDGANTRVNVSRPLKSDAWWQDSEGFLATNAWGDDVPHLWLSSKAQEEDEDEEEQQQQQQQQQQNMQLCVYQHRALTLLMFISAEASATSTSLLKKHIVEKTEEKIQMLEERLTKQWSGINASHVAGYRYMHYDMNRNTMKASPPNKVATLSKESLCAVNRVREQVDSEKERREIEVCLRSKNNAWIAVRRRAGEELYVVLEKASDTLLHASEAVERFNTRHFEGRFSSD